MKKSCLVAVIAVLAAVAGALAAVALYLNRREKELDEYERLLRCIQLCLNGFQLPGLLVEPAAVLLLVHRWKRSRAPADR